MKFKVGDTVIPHGECEETKLNWGFISEMRELIGKKLSVEKVRGEQVVARYRQGRKFSWHENDLTLVSRIKYKPLRTINIVKLLSAADETSCPDLKQAMKDAVWEICGNRGWGRYRNIPFEDVIAFAKQYDGGIEWLIKEGFVEEDKPKREYKSGQVYKKRLGFNAGEYYLLTDCGLLPYEWALVNMDNYSTRWVGFKETAKEAFGKNENEFELVCDKLVYNPEQILIREHSSMG